MLEKIHNTIAIPAIIVHELLHILLVKLTFSKLTSVFVSVDKNFSKNGRVEVGVGFCSQTKAQEIIVCMAPFIGLFFWTIPLLFNMNILSYIMLGYTILCIKTIIPSKDDFSVFKKKDSKF